MTETAAAADTALAGLTMAPSFGDGMPAPRATFDFECVGRDGEVKWRDSFTNLVTAVGKTDILDKYLKGSAYTAAWFLVLKGTGTPAAADTLASHAGWAEVTPYAGTNRPTITWGTTAAGANTSIVVAVAINATATVAGAGICASQPIATTSGVLYNAGDFAAARSVASGDTLNITVTLSIT